MEAKVWEIDISGTPPKTPPPKSKTPRPKPGPESNPGVAVSSSLILTGMGQIYNGQIKLGVLFFLIMVSVYVLSGVLLMNWPAVDAIIGDASFTHSDFAVFYGSVLVLAALIWYAGIIQAYVEAAGYRRTPYSGTPHRVLPAFLSLIIPGWGQFMNGQAKKGGLCLALTTLSFLGGAMSFFILLVWDHFQDEAARQLWENILVISLLPITIAPLLWLYCFYDALVVGLDEVKKESLWKRFIYAKNRLRIKGWKASVVNPAMVTGGFIAALALFGAAGYKFIEKDFYFNALASARGVLEQKKMVILPELVAQGQSLMDPTWEKAGGPESNQGTHPAMWEKETPEGSL